MRPRAPVALLLLALAAACGSTPATGLVVVVDADPALLGRLATVRVQTFAARGTTPIDQQVFPVVAPLVFPFSFGVSPRAGSTEVRVEVAGFEAGRSAGLVFARASTRFVEGRVLAVPIVLWGACAGRPPCDEGATCGASRACEPGAALRDPASLAPYTPGVDGPCMPGFVRDARGCVRPPDAAAPADAPAADADRTDAVSSDVGADAGADAGVDAGADVGADAGADVGVDTGADVGVDTGADVGVDVGVDTGADAGVDAGADAGVDAGADVGVDSGADVGADSGEPACPAGRVRCAAGCVALLLDVENCGACGLACATGDRCLAGRCGLAVDSVSAGARHTCAALHNGDVRCWGSSATNELANGDLRAFSTPQVAALPLDVAEVAAGAGGGCARHGTASRVTCWGRSDDGALGIGVALPGFRGAAQPVESAAGPLAGVAAISFVGSHACARGGDGRVWCWGANDRGQVGDGTLVPRARAVQLAAPTGVASIATSVRASYALTATGVLYAWGENTRRQLGDPSFMGDARATPTPVEALTAVTAVFAGGDNACVLAGAAGDLYCWGANDAGQLGAAPSPAAQPVRLTAPGEVREVGLGAGFLCVRLADRTVHCRGANALGQLGDGTQVNRGAFVRVVGVSDAVALSAGLDHACALGASGAVRCWGSDRLGQTGSGRVLFRAAPALVPSQPVAGAAAVMASESSSCLRTPANAMDCWGGNARGELGDGTLVGSGTPVAVLGSGGLAIAGVGPMAGGQRAHCALTPTAFGRAVSCWGANAEGTLGVGTLVDERLPRMISTLGSVTALGLRHLTACAVHSPTGTLSCWGRNDTGQAGPPEAGNPVTAPRVVYADQVTAAAPGHGHTCALRGDGRAVCFGQGSSGEFGDGSVGATRPPPAFPPSNAVLVASSAATRTLIDFSELASGLRFSCGIDRNSGIVRCWGANDMGQLGRGAVDGEAHSNADPVVGLPGGTVLITRLAVGTSHACAVGNDQRVYCWGDNRFGATGAVESAPTRQATLVAGLSNITDVAAGASHTCALDRTAGVRCWGLNFDNQLGSLVPALRTTAVTVANVR